MLPVLGTISCRHCTTWPHIQPPRQQLMHSVASCAGDVVMKQGDMGNEMYFIAEGTVEVGRQLVGSYI